MGMAASQARYLALTARKSNCEYEGQQINQQRTILANETASLFNQMLGLTVPTPPSTSDYTTIQYSYSDGVNTWTISDWQQLGTSDENYNYVITSYYYADVYTGSQKQLSDPQVQFTGTIPTDSSSYSANIAEIQAALLAIEEAEAAYEEASDNYSTLKSKCASLSYYAASTTGNTVEYSSSTATNDSGNEYITSETYSVTDTDGTTTVYTGYDYLDDNDKETVDTLIASLIEAGALDEDFDYSTVYYNGSNGTIAFADDLAAVADGTTTTLATYSADDIETLLEELAEAKTAMNQAQVAVDAAELAYEELSVPEYVGNCALTALSSLTDTQLAEIAQIIETMEEEDIDSSIAKCFDEDGNYTGGIYTFTLNGTTYYTTYYDLAESASSGTGANQIDGQTKLAYYNASYVSTKIEQTQKALLETDSSGRFTSVRLENDTVTYTLTVETTTDEDSYNDAMNQYYYETAIYDQTVQEINAKTSIIQQEDQQLELQLQQLDTEQNALSTEMDAVKKVVEDNIETSFKVFGG